MGKKAEKEFREVLEKIVTWELPDTGKFWDEEKTRPMTYEACYGSSGSRDYFKTMAYKVLVTNVPDKLDELI